MTLVGSKGHYFCTENDLNRLYEFLIDDNDKKETNQQDKNEGENLGKYKIVEELGSGSFAVTYLAEDTVTNKTVALKVLKDNRDKNMLKRDVMPLTKLKHKNIVKYIDCNIINGEMYIATEYCGGGTLSSYISKNLHESIKFKLINDLFLGIYEIHKNGITHRDIKPDNLFMHKNVLKIGDFGISVDSPKTIMDKPSGTPKYMSPEQKKGKISQKCDVWASGLVALEIVYGSIPDDLKSIKKFKICKNEKINKVIIGCLISNHSERISSSQACNILFSD